MPHLAQRRNGDSRCSMLSAAVCCVLLAAGCAAEKPRLAVPVNTNPSPYASGKTHVEPLFYNGKTYQVRMQHVVTEQVFDVNVSAPGRTLGNTPGDERIVSEVGRNAVNHFACPDGQRARLDPGSARPAVNSGWDMRVRCVYPRGLGSAWLDFGHGSGHAASHEPFLADPGGRNS